VNKNVLSYSLNTTLYLPIWCLMSRCYNAKCKKSTSVDNDVVRGIIRLPGEVSRIRVLESLLAGRVRCSDKLSDSQVVHIGLVQCMFKSRV